VGATFSVWVDAGSIEGVEKIADLGEIDDEAPIERAVAEDIVLDGRVLLRKTGKTNQELLSSLLTARGGRSGAGGDGRAAVQLAMAPGAASISC